MTPLKKCCWMHFNHLKISNMLFKNSQCCYAIYHSDFQGLSSPTGYCHVQKRDRQFTCTNRSCLKKRGNSKKMKLWTICLFYILFCVLKMSCVSGPVNTAPLSASGESNKDIFIFLLFWTLVWTSLPEAIESSTSLDFFKSKQWLHSYSYLILYHYCILFYGWCDVLVIFTGLICVDIRVDVDEDVQPHVDPQQLLLSKKLVWVQDQQLDLTWGW